MKKLFSATALGLVIAATGVSAHADDNTDARIEKLEEEIQALKQELNAQKQQQVAASKAAQDAQISAQQAQIAAKTAQSAPAVQAANTGSVTVNNKGLTATSADGNYQLRLHGYVQADDKTYVDDKNKATNTDGFYIRSARPILEGQFFQDFDTRLMLDFGNNSTGTTTVRLLDAYADYKPWQEANLRVGKFKDPIGLERWESESDVLFVERGQATNLVPYRDIGLQVYGDLIPKTLEYQLALVNGAADFVDENADSDNSKDVVGRVFAHPFHDSGISALSGLGIGVAGSYGNRSGTSANSDLTAGYKTTSQTTYFSYAAGSYGSGRDWRINPELYYSWGPFGLLGEYTLESQEIAKTGAKTTDLDNEAYTAIASYVLTGENAAFDGVVPDENFNPSKNQWGAWEVLGRVSRLHVDDNTFPTFAVASTSARSDFEKALGVTWYLNTNLKVNFDYANNSFDGGAIGGADRSDENVFLSRVQFRF